MDSVSIKNLIEMINSLHYIVLVLLMATISCTYSASPKLCQIDDHPDKIDVMPVAERKLEEQLHEISGQSFDEQGRLWVHNDEDGEIYELDTVNFTVKNTIQFGEGGDYEGISIWKERAYIVSSQKQLTSFNLNSPGILTTSSLKGLPLVCELESILVNNMGVFTMCKTTATTPNYLLYRFEDPAKLSRPKAVIDFSPCINTILASQGHKAFEALPTDIEFSEGDSCWLILTNKPAFLFIFHENGGLKSYFSIEKNMLNQPEGVSVDKNGRIWISSEGKKRGKMIVLDKL